MNQGEVSLPLLKETTCLRLRKQPLEETSTDAF